MKNRKPTKTKDAHTDIKRYLAYTLISFGVIFILGEIVSHTKYINHIRAPLYDVAQVLFFANPKVKLEEIPYIVDITGIEMTDGFTPNEKVTSLPKMEKLIAALKRMNVKAIGIDVDLGPRYDKYNNSINPPRYVNFWRRLSNDMNNMKHNIPVVIGINPVSKDLYDDPLAGIRDSSKLVGSMLIPDTFRGEYDEYIHIDNADEKRVYSLGYQLGLRLQAASGGDQPIANPKSWYRDFELVDENSNTGAKEFNHKSVLLDYSMLHKYPLKSPPKMEDSSSPYIISFHNLIYETAPTPETMKNMVELKKRLTNRIVLIGRFADPIGWDLFQIPGHQLPLPGILIHAAAIYNFQNSSIIPSVLNRRGSFAVDLCMLVILVIGTLIVSRFISKKGIDAIDTADRVAKPFLKLAFIAVLFIVFIGMLSIYRIIWDGILIFLVIQILDEPVSLLIHFPKTWRKLK